MEQWQLPVNCKGSVTSNRTMPHRQLPLMVMGVPSRVLVVSRPRCHAESWQLLVSGRVGSTRLIHFAFQVVEDMGLVDRRLFPDDNWEPENSGSYSRRIVYCLCIAVLLVLASSEAFLFLHGTPATNVF
jgi:hypothetical protein